MAIVGINLTKINSERTGDIKGKINVNNNVVIKSVESARIGLALKEKGIQVGFAFKSNYAPNIGKIEIEGKILLLESEENAKNIIESWNKSKRLPPILMQQLFTTILRKCNIKALVLSEDIGLPSPIRLPEVRIAKKAPKTTEQKQAKKPEVKKK